MVWGMQGHQEIENFGVTENLEKIDIGKTPVVWGNLEGSGNSGKTKHSKTSGVQRNRGKTGYQKNSGVLGNCGASGNSGKMGHSKNTAAHSKSSRKSEHIFRGHRITFGEEIGARLLRKSEHSP